MDKVWLYYEELEDSKYRIRVFSTKEKAENFLESEKPLGYVYISEFTIDEGVKAAFKYDEWKCPDCGSSMKSRTGGFGTFWGCVKYPGCRGTRDSNGLSKAERAALRDRSLDSEPDKRNSETLPMISFERKK